MLTSKELVENREKLFVRRMWQVTFRWRKKTLLTTNKLLITGLKHFDINKTIINHNEAKLYLYSVYGAIDLTVNKVSKLELYVTIQSFFDRELCRLLLVFSRRLNYFFIKMDAWSIIDHNNANTLSVIEIIRLQAQNDS